MDTKEIRDYFDENFRVRRSKRHVLIMQQLQRLPLDLGKTALVLGCGAGHVAINIARQGTKVKALDISPKAIEYAKQNNHNKNVSYLVADATEFEVGRLFDFIILPGIIDHVLPNKLPHLLKNVAKHSSRETVIYANFLVRQFGEFRRQNFKGIPPENCIDLNLLIKMFEVHGFVPMTLETTGIGSPLEYYEIMFVAQAQCEYVWDKVYNRNQESPPLEVSDVSDKETLEGE
ncbi:MAG: class I SAM-dependent methyltransferase [Candidatus Thorarchaeota archaeon]|jgi:SAM-dependent methyltransferase